MDQDNLDEVLSLYAALKNEIDRFYRKNADMDASGMIDLRPVRLASTKLGLFLTGDFRTLWELERVEASELRNELRNMEEDTEYKFQNQIYQEPYVNSLQRELKIMTRCAKKLSESLRNECRDHEETKLMLEKNNSQN